MTSRQREAIAASSGTYILVPRGTAHTFSAAAGGGRFLLLMLPIERDRVLLPRPHPAVGTDEMATRSGRLLFVSGHGAFDDGRPTHTGRLGDDRSTAEGIAAALNLLATVKADVGDLSRVARILNVVVFVNSAPHYTDQHLVADGATDLLGRVFGDRRSRPARPAVGVAAVPLGFAVEIEAIIEVNA